LTETTAPASSSAVVAMRVGPGSASATRLVHVLVGSYLALTAATWALAAFLALGWLAAFDHSNQAAFATVPLLLGAWLLVLAVLTFRRKPADAMSRGYVVLLASMALALAGMFDQASTRSLTWSLLIGLALTGGAYLHLSSVFPREFPLVLRIPAAQLIAYLLAATMASIALWIWSRAAAPERLAPALSFVFGWVLLSGGIYLIIASVLSVSTSSSIIQRLQSRLIAGTMLIGLAPLLVGLMPPRSHTPDFFPYLALPSVLPCLALGYSMFRFRVTGAAQWLRHGVIYGLLVLVIMLAYGLVVAGLTLVFRTGVPTTSPWWVAGLAVAVALLVEPIRTRVQATADRILFRGNSALAETVRAFTADLNAANDIDSITGVLRRVLETVLQPESTHMFVYDAPADRYAAVGDTGNRPTTELHFGTDSALAMLLGQSLAPVLIDLKSLPSRLLPERNRLTLLGACMFLPFSVRANLLGWLALGPRSTGQPYSTSDIALLEQLGEQASLAMGRVQVVQGLERRIRDMNALTRVAQGVNITLTFDDVLELIYAQTAQIIPLTHFYITLHNAQADASSFAFALENNERVTERENAPLPPNTDLAREVLRRGRPISTANYELECSAAGLSPATAGIRSWMGVLLNTGAESIGVLSAGSREMGVTYTQSQLDLLQAIADQTAGAIVKAGLLRETEQRAVQLSKLNEVTRQLASTLDMDALRQVIADGAAGILDCEAAIFYVPDQTTGALVVSSISGSLASDLLGRAAPVGVGHVFRAAASRSPEIENELDLSAATHLLTQVGSGWVPRSSIAVPLQFQDTLVGVLEVLNRRDGGPFVAEDESLLRAFAGQAVVALENVRLYTLTDQELTARVDELSVMQRIDRELNASLEMDRAMRITLEWALRQSNAEAGLIGLLDNDRLRIVTEMGYGTSPGDSTDRSLSLTFPGYQAAVDTALPQRVRFDVVGTGGFLPASDHQVVIPIRREAAVIGLLVLESTRSAQEDLGFLSRLSDHAAIAISNAQLYDEVQRANIAKSDFVSLVAHELKNPMTSIKGYTELLAAGAVGPVNEMQANFLNTIRSNTERMSTLVSDLNDNSKIEAGKLRLDFKSVELAEVVEEIVRSANRQIEEKKQKVGLELAEQLPPIWADRTRLGQVLTNLVSNANKYTSEGGSLVIGAEPSPNHWDPAGAGQVVHVWVRDSGIGISPEDQERIFEKFFRSEDPKAREVPGAGLGLNITRSLVEMQGGLIWFESQHRQGTTFHFTVPVAEG
jgi:signal transduction histidine kinase